MSWALAVAVAVIAYLVGSIPNGLILTRVARGVDVRDYGSGKTGGTNVLRTAGPKLGILVMALDIAKGLIAVYVARVLSDQVWAHAVAGILAAIGHDWPVFAGFRGGRGVSTSYGAALALNPTAAAIALPFAAAMVLASRRMSVMSIGGASVTAVIFVIFAAAGWTPIAYAAYTVAAAVLLIVLHRDNVQRLLAGTEPKIGQGGRPRAEAAGGR